MYLKASADVKLSTFSGENGGDEVVDHEMDLTGNASQTMHFSNYALLKLCTFSRLQSIEILLFTDPRCVYSALTITWRKYSPPLVCKH